MAFATLKQLADEIDLAAHHKGPATFNVGDKCIYRRTGAVVVITKGYQQRIVADPNGDLVDPSSGRVVAPRFGYQAQGKDGKLHFYLAGDLLDHNSRERHVQLVWPPKPMPAAKPRKARRADPFKASLLKAYAEKLDARTLRVMREAVAEGFAKGHTTQDIIASIRRASGCNEAQAS